MTNQQGPALLPCRLLSEKQNSDRRNLILSLIINPQPRKNAQGEVLPNQRHLQYVAATLQEAKLVFDGFAEAVVSQVGAVVAVLPRCS